MIFALLSQNVNLLIDSLEVIFDTVAKRINWSFLYVALLEKCLYFEFILIQSQVLLGKLTVGIF